VLNGPTRHRRPPARDEPSDDRWEVLGRRGPACQVEGFLSTPSWRRST